MFSLLAKAYASAFQCLKNLAYKYDNVLPDRFKSINYSKIQDRAANILDYSPVLCKNTAFGRGGEFPKTHTRTNADARAHAHTCEELARAYTRTRARTRTHAHTHMHTHHTHTEPPAPNLCLYMRP